MAKKSALRSVGLDLGTSSIKVTLLDIIADEKVLTGYNIKNVPLDAKSGQKETLIKDIFQEIDIDPESVNLSISGPDVIVRFIDLPVMTKEQLSNALVFEAEKYIPFNISEVVLDSIIMGESSEPGQMRVLLAAAKREPIENLFNMMENIGIGINCVDIDPFAVFNAYLNTLAAPEKEGCAFLILGYSTTDILISLGEQPCFVRQIQIAGKDVTCSISKSCSVSMERAEQLKHDPGEELRNGVFQATTVVLEDLIREMQLSFGYFENRFNKNIKSVYASGGMVYQDGVLDFLSGKLGVEVKRLDPFKGIKFDEAISREDIESVSSLLAVSLGLSLRG